MSTTLKSLLVLSSLATLVAVDGASAQNRGRRDGSGPVGVACQSDIALHCKGLSHGGGAVRSCLERNRTDVSKSCAAALGNTGSGRRNR